MRKRLSPESRLQVLEKPEQNDSGSPSMNPRNAALGVTTGRRSVVLYATLSIVFFCLSVYDAHAAKAAVNVVQNGILQGSLVMQLQAEEVFTEEVIESLNTGLTAKIDYTIELWRSRSWWFDHLDIQHNISYQIDFRPLDKRYVCTKSRKGEVTESKLDPKLDSIIEWTIRPDPPLKIIPVQQLDPEDSYYYNITMSIATLTAENIDYLLKSEEKEEGSSPLTNIPFRFARRVISSRHRKKLSKRSEKFNLRDLPNLSR